MFHFFKTLIIDEMTSTRWLEFNDIEYFVKQIHQNMSWNVCLVECATLFHSRVNMFMHQHILNYNDILGFRVYFIFYSLQIILIIHYEIQHYGFVHVHIIG
jgi:hypothetical protein